MSKKTMGLDMVGGGRGVVAVGSGGDGGGVAGARAASRAHSSQTMPEARVSHPARGAGIVLLPPGAQLARAAGGAGGCAAEGGRGRKKLTRRPPPPTLHPTRRAHPHAPA